MRGGLSAGDEGAGAVPAEDFAAAHSELLANPAIQFEMKGEAVALPDPPRLDIDPISLPSGSGDGSIALVLFWVIVGLAAAGLLYLIVTRFTGWERRDRSAKAAAPDAWQIEEEPARKLLDDADALAAAGRYAEAAHLLLHRSIAEIDERRPATVRKALTSRDIAAIPSIPPSPAAAFDAIVRTVERSLFGRRTLGAEEWQRCRAAYERFAFAREWQA